MMKKKLSTRIFATFLTFTMVATSSTAYASTNFIPTKTFLSNSDLTIYTSDIPEEAFTYAEDIAPVLLASVLETPQKYDVTKSELKDCTIGTPYTIPIINADSSISSSDIYYFPVVSNDSVILILTIHKTNGTWGASIGKDYSESLDSLSPSANYLFYSQDNCIYAENKTEKVILEENTLVQTTSNTVKKDSSFTHLSYEDKIDTIETELGKDLETVEPLIPTETEENIVKKAQSFTSSTTKKTPAAALLGNSNSSAIALGNGFTTDTTNTKYLDMTDCLVNQQDSSGTERGMCWAASVATIVRYITGDRSLRAWDVCDTMGIGYDDGGTINDMLTALNTYNVTGYAVRSSQCSWSQITSDISNQKPIAIGAITTRSYNGQYYGHAVTVTGYNTYSSSYKTIRIWNSGSQQNQVLTYSTRGTTFSYANYNWVWQTSVY